MNGKIIDASEVAENLSTIADKPTTESQVRPLSKLKPEEQREVWKGVVTETNGTPSQFAGPPKRQLARVVGTPLFCPPMVSISPVPTKVLLE